MSMQASTQPSSQPGLRKPVATWRKVLAAVLDTLFVFFITGFAVGYLTGNLTDGGHGFELKGTPALIVLFVVGGYFAVFTKFLGGTVWQRVLGVR
jgi:hypothetical protein